MLHDEIIARLSLLEYHQKLLLKIIHHSNRDFYKLVIEKSMQEADVEKFFSLCDKLTIELKEQKAEGFVHFHPLFEKFKINLHPQLNTEEVIQSCLNQQLYVPLMEELKKCIKD